MTEDPREAFMEGYMARWNDELSSSCPYVPANGGKAGDQHLRDAWWGGYDKRVQEEQNLKNAVPTRERGGLAGSPSSQRPIIRREH